MPEMFPTRVGITQIKGVLKIIGEYDGSISMSALADETNEQIDDLLPLLKACEMLGYIDENGGIVKFKQQPPPQITRSAFLSNAKEKLPSMEPFKTVLRLVEENKVMTTAELAQKLSELGMPASYDPAQNEHDVREYLMKWGVRLKLLKYRTKKDEWYIK